MVFQRLCSFAIAFAALCAALLGVGTAVNISLRYAKRSDGWHCSKGRREGVIWCKLLRFGSSFYHLIFIDASDHLTSNVDAFRKATVRHVLREVSLGPLVILRPALLSCPRCARCSSANDRQPKRAREPSGDSPGRVVVAFGPSAVGGRFTTFEQQLGARAS